MTYRLSQLIPYGKFVVYGFVATLLIVAWIYGQVIYNRAQRVPELEQRVEQLSIQIENERAQIENERAQHRIALEVEGELRKKLADADRRAHDFARRLRNALRRVPEVAPAPAGPERTEPSEPGVNSIGLDAAINRVRAECAAAGVLEQGWHDWYGRIPCELKAEGC